MKKLTQTILKLIMILYIFIIAYVLFYDFAMFLVTEFLGGFYYRIIGYIASVIIHLLFFVYIGLIIHSIVNFIKNKNNRYFYILILYSIASNIFVLTIGSLEDFKEAFIDILSIIGENNIKVFIISNAILLITYVFYLINKEKEKINKNG